MKYEVGWSESVVEGDLGVAVSGVVEFHPWDFWLSIRPVSEARRGVGEASPLLSGTGEVGTQGVVFAASGSGPFWSTSGVEFSIEA